MTAMQELIEYIESNEIVYNKDLILKLKELLEKEKEQIEQSYVDGIIDAKDDTIQGKKDYYNQTYKQKK